MKSKLRAIMHHFGHNNQATKLEEECKEYLESGEDEEVADIFILSSQIYQNSPRIQRIVEEKIERTLDRIESGYYEERV